MNRDPKPKTTDEAIVLFDSKETRDAVKDQAHNLLVKYGNWAGMRLHVPNYLQKDFRALMNLAYNLKKKNPGLKCNVKFDEDNYGLFMDVQIVKDGPWRRVKPDQARQAAGKMITNGPTEMDASELTGLLGEDEVDLT